MNFLKKLVFLWLLSLIVAPALSWAGISVSPSNQEVILKKNEVFKDYFTIFNENDQPVQLNNSVRDWFILPENKANGMESSSFLTFYPTFFYLPAGGQADLFYEIRVPTYAVGSSMSMMSFTAAAASGISMRISVSVAMSVEKTEKISWNIQGIKFNFGQNQDQVTAALDVTNTGNVYVRPVGKMIVTGKNDFKCQFNFEEEKPVYPGLSRALFANSEKACSLAEGKYKAEVTLESWKDFKPWAQIKKQKFQFEVTQDRQVKFFD